jgi:DNA-directed RNA polymerase subunit K/omega
MPEDKTLPELDEINLSDIDINPEDSDVESLNLSEPPDSDDDEAIDDSDDDEAIDDSDDDAAIDDSDDDAAIEDSDDDEDVINNLDIDGGLVSPTDSDEDDSDEDGIEMQKINKDNVQQYIIENHPERIMHNQQEIDALSKVFRNKNGDIEDDFHKTVPFITRFEKTKVLGLRARQLNNAPDQALVKVDMGIIDGYKIAQEEYKQKLIPFIIKRPLPDGSCEYWKFEDLEQIE